VAGQHEPSRVGPDLPGIQACQVLADPVLRISDHLQGVGQLADGDPISVVMLPPRAEEFNDALPPGVVRLQSFDPFDWIAASKCEERISAPLRPVLKASKRLALWDGRRIRHGHVGLFGVADASDQMFEVNWS
jgi:hypothetical protein